MAPVRCLRTLGLDSFYRTYIRNLEKKLKKIKVSSACTPDTVKLILEAKMPQRHPNKAQKLSTMQLSCKRCKAIYSTTKRHASLCNAFDFSI